MQINFRESQKGIIRVFRTTTFDRVETFRRPRVISEHNVTSKISTLSANVYTTMTSI